MQHFLEGSIVAASAEVVEKKRGLATVEAVETKREGLFQSILQAGVCYDDGKEAG